MLSERIAAIAADRVSGASEILDRAIGVLRDALAGRADIVATARAIVRAQPSMAPMWNAALAAMDARDDPGRFEAFAGRVAAAPHALRRVAMEFIDAAGWTSRPRGATLHIVTLSYSGSVFAILEAAGASRPLTVSCGEGRPAMEGRALATRLAGRQIPVTLMTDASLGQALASADAVFTGADAIAARWFVNKCGTRMLATTAAADGVPVYVVAASEKFVPASVASRLTIREGAAAEVWPDRPAGVAVKNVCFERTPLDVVTGLITDRGVLDPREVGHVCSALDRETPDRLVAALDE